MNLFDRLDGVLISAPTSSIDSIGHLEHKIEIEVPGCVVYTYIPKQNIRCFLFRLQRSIEHQAEATVDGFTKAHT